MQVEMELDLFLGNGQCWSCGTEKMLACTHQLLSVCSTSRHPSPLPCWWSSSTFPGGGSWTCCLPCGSWVGLLLLLVLLVPGLVFGPLGKAPAPKGGKALPTVGAAGFTSLGSGLKPPSPGAGVGFSAVWSLSVPPSGQRTGGPPPSPQPSPSLGPSQASLMNALAMLRNVSESD